MRPIATLYLYVPNTINIARRVRERGCNQQLGSLQDPKQRLYIRSASFKIV